MKINASARLHFSNQIEYAHWHAVMSSYQNPNQVQAFDLWRPFQGLGAVKKIQELFSDFKKWAIKIVEQTGLEFMDVIEAFKTKPMFAFLKAIRFSFNLLLKPLKAFSKLYKDGILKVFETIHKSGAFQKLHSGAMKLDEFLDQYPMLKRLTGPAVAGLLIWMWISGNFTGHPDLDMDLSALVNAALKGSWSAAELFTSPQGLAALTLLFTGLALPWPTPAWLDEAIPFNLLVALCYTAFSHLRDPKFKAALSKLKPHIKFGSVR